MRSLTFFNHKISRPHIIFVRGNLADLIPGLRRNLQVGRDRVLEREGDVVI
ncbi:MAG: hypothetical protein K0S56_1028 [Microvirga sp.]|nr:hypothetical protein [Microvirga sp.]